jgi:hypothetical protein
MVLGWVPFKSVSDRPTHHSGGQDCQTQYWKGTTQGPSQPNLL